MYRTLGLSVCLVFLLVLAGSVVTIGAVRGTLAPGFIAASSVEEQVFQAINRVRSENKLPLLTLKSDLSTVARFHSSDMAAREYFSHVTPDGDNLQKRISRGGITDWIRLAENLAANQGHSDPAATAVRSWLQSPSHRTNIMDASVTETGIGVAVDEKGRVYITQLFAKRKN